MSRPRRHSILVITSIWVATMIGSAGGCGSERAGASSNATASGDKQTAQAADPAAGAVDPARAPAARPKLLPGTKTVALAAAGDRPYDKTFDDLRFEIEPGQAFRREMLPESIEAMAGQRIRIRGFILPTPQKRGIRAFVLVRDNQQCCFGPGAALYDCILVEMQSGQTAEFSIRPVAVEGAFDIREIRGPDGMHLAIYHLAGESVR
jgi:hypothetical protein